MSYYIIKFTDQDGGVFGEKEIAVAYGDGGAIDAMTVSKSGDLLKKVLDLVDNYPDKVKVSAPRVWSDTMEIKQPKYILGIIKIEKFGKIFELTIGSDCFDGVCDGGNNDKEVGEGGNKFTEGEIEAIDLALKTLNPELERTEIRVESNSEYIAFMMKGYETLIHAGENNIDISFVDNNIIFSMSKSKASSHLTYLSIINDYYRFKDIDSNSTHDTVIEAYNSSLVNLAETLVKARGYKKSETKLVSEGHYRVIKATVGKVVVVVTDIEKQGSHVNTRGISKVIEGVENLPYI